MGYDLHIHRSPEDWSEAADGIAGEEWRAFVESAEDFTLTGGVAAQTPDGETLSYENPDLAVWNDHPDGTEVPFDFRDGRVVVKNPDAPTIERMVQVAASLAARVQGDDGEWYPEEASSDGRSKRRWWRR